MRIAVEKVSHTYGHAQASATPALVDIDLAIAPGQLVGLVGATGSGKTTLAHVIAGLVWPAAGRVAYDGLAPHNQRQQRQMVRGKVGLVFQYPEDQLFGATVAEDVGFGPKNLGLGPAEEAARVDRALALVGLDPPTFKGRLPLGLSGGEKRRVALAGVLAMQPEVLILDEPTAGLDPQNRRIILEEIGGLHRRLGLTVILISHQMDEIARYAERVAVLDHGRVAMDGRPEEVFARAEALTALSLALPPATQLLVELRRRGLEVNTGALTLEAAADILVAALGTKKVAES